jgi:hypothetical protein
LERNPRRRGIRVNLRQIHRPSIFRGSLRTAGGSQGPRPRALLPASLFPCSLRRAW